MVDVSTEEERLFHRDSPGEKRIFQDITFDENDIYRDWESYTSAEHEIYLAHKCYPAYNC